MTDSTGLPWEDRLRTRFVAARKSLGLTQADVARSMKAGGFAWHQQTVQRFETGERPPRLNEAYSLALIVGQELNDFMHGDQVEHALDVWRLAQEEMMSAELAEGTLSACEEAEKYLEEIDGILAAEPDPRSREMARATRESREGLGRIREKAAELLRLKADWLERSDQLRINMEFPLDG